ncbi:hypothetical protein [Streptosporangium sp. NPDC002721]|uniref:hypothetical protein n=1 Tax=Streptosporangium sp. NPDC002721 TaxID=3366188 RepID=UPI003693E666
MHVPPSPNSPGEPEILTGPADEPRKPRKRKPQRMNGLAIAVFSVLAAALLGGGAVFAFMNAGRDDPRLPPAPDSAQETSQEAGPDRNPPQPGKQEPEKGADAASGGGGTGTGSGNDADTDTDTGTGSGSGSGGADESGPGGESAAGQPSKNKPSKQPQSGQQDSPEDDPAGYVHPQGPVGGY